MPARCLDRGCVISTPMALLSRTQTTCEAEPAPAEANCSLSRLARNCALNSPRVAAGKSLRTSRTAEFSTKAATGANSASASYIGFLLRIWL